PASGYELRKRFMSGDGVMGGCTHYHSPFLGQSQPTMLPNTNGTATGTIQRANIDPITNVATETAVSNGQMDGEATMAFRSSEPSMRRVPGVSRLVGSCGNSSGESTCNASSLCGPAFSFTQSGKRSVTTGGWAKL